MGDLVSYIIVGGVCSFLTWAGCCIAVAIEDYKKGII